MTTTVANQQPRINLANGGSMQSAQVGRGRMIPGAIPSSFGGGGLGGGCRVWGAEGPPKAQVLKAVYTAHRAQKKKISPPPSKGSKTNKTPFGLNNFYFVSDSVFFHPFFFFFPRGGRWWLVVVSVVGLGEEGGDF